MILTIQNSVNILGAANAYTLVIIGLSYINIKSKNPIEGWTALAFIVGGIDVLLDIMVRTNLTGYFPHVLYLTHPLEYILAPIIYLLFNMQVDRSYKIKRYHVFLFVPAMVVTAVMAPYFVQTGPQKIAQGVLWNVMSPYWAAALHIIDFGTFIALFFALLAFIVRILSIFWNSQY